MIIVSLASYDKRFSYLQKTVSSILNQTLKYDKLIINIPDDSSKETVFNFKSLEKLDGRIEVKIRDHRWRSANKLLWTAKDNPEAVIITCDDDIFYPEYFFEEQYKTWKQNTGCIIAQEISPVFIIDNEVHNIAAVDVKLKQKCFGRYLTGCCLFPPHVLDNTEAYDFDKFFYITHATHDELWFWIMTTMKGIRSIGLNLTYSFDSDETVLPRDENSLSFINNDPYLKDYNRRINEKYGKELFDIVSNQIVEFDINIDNLLGFCGTIDRIYQTYGKYYRIQLNCNKTILKSHLKFMSKFLNKLNWTKGVGIKI